MKRRLALTSAFAGAAALLITLSGCGTQKIADYANEKPALDLRSYFNGTLDAYGVFTDRSGKVVKRFTVVMNCTWQGDNGVLDEDFSYSDGTQQKRVWRLTRLADGRYTGRADDVVGEALGESRGNAFHWTYTLSLPVDGKPSDAGPPQGASAPSGLRAAASILPAQDWTARRDVASGISLSSKGREATSVGATIIQVQFDDWMYLVNDKVMLNKAAMSKFGIHLGEVTLSFTKR